VVLTWANLRVMRAYASAEQGHELWIKDYRVAMTGTAAAEVIREKGLGSGKLGVVGLRSQAPTEVHGAIPATGQPELTEALPGLAYEAVSEEFSHRMRVKSAAELAHARH